MKRMLSVPVAFVFLIATAALWAWSPQPQRAAIPKPSGLVQTAPVTQAPASRNLRVSGVTRASRTATLSFPVPARLASRAIDAGQRVRKGQVLAKLDASQFQHAAAAARAQLAEVDVRLAQSKRDLQRVDQLHAASAIPDGQREHALALVEGLEAGRAAARAGLADAQRVLTETTLRAPFDGTVTVVALEPGEMAAPGHPIVHLTGDGPLQLQVELSESAALRVREGAPARAAFPFAAGRVVPGRVASVARAAVGPGRLFPVIVDLDPDEHVVAGMTAELLLDLEAPPALCVPIRAVLNPGSSQPFVFRVQDGSAQRVPVKVGELLDACVRVEGGLASGDRIIVMGHTSLVDGDSVREVP